MKPLLFLFVTIVLINASCVQHASSPPKKEQSLKDSIFIVSIFGDTLKYSKVVNDQS